MTNQILLNGEQQDLMRRNIEELRRYGGSLFDALDRSSLAIVVTNPRLPDNPIVFVNDGFRRLTGYAEEEAIGRNPRFMRDAEADPASVAEIRDALRQEREIATEILNVRRDATKFWNSLSITPLYDDHGSLIFFLSIQSDNTQTHKAQAAQTALEQKQEQLDKINERLRLTLAVAGAAGTWDWEIATQRIVADARFAALYGLNPIEAATGVPSTAFFSIIHPEDRTRIRIAVAGALDGAEIFSKEYRLLTPERSVRWVHARGRCHFDADHKPTRFTGILVDITEQKRTEEQLRIAQTAGGVGTFEHVTGFATATVSGQFCRLLGLRPTNVLSVRTINSMVHPENAVIIEADDFAEPGKLSYAEFRVTRADDGAVRWLARRGEHIRDTGTAGTRYMGVIYDVTAAKQAQEKLRELNETLESRVEERTRERDRVWSLSRDLFSIFDFDLKLIAINPAWSELSGYTREELLGRSITSLLHEEDWTAIAEQLDSTSPTQPSRDYDARLCAKDGSHHWINWKIVRENDAFYGIGRDVTQRKQLEAQLRQSQKMEAVGQLTGGIAHDFNNLLTGILGSLDIVRRKLTPALQLDVQRFMDAATNSAQRAAALTHRLLAFSRRQSLDNKPINVNALVASIEDLLHGSLGEQIELVVRLGEDIWPAFTDGNQLESALLNLAINARDAMPGGGKLTIETNNTVLTPKYARRHEGVIPGDYTCISVSDTGTGMSADVIAKAFDPFFTTKPIGQGTGLGLSMIYGFVQQSNGHVHIDSQVGSGTTINLYLPRHLEQEGALEPASATPAAPPRGDGEIVLVVEDDASVRMLVMEVLRDLGYTALEAHDGSSALPILASNRPIDLMVSDVGLPGINGRQLAEIARQTRPDLRILFISGYAENAVSRAQFLAPGMEMIVKPFALDDLAHRIKRIIASNTPARSG